MTLFTTTKSDLLAKYVKAGTHLHRNQEWVHTSEHQQPDVCIAMMQLVEVNLYLQKEEAGKYEARFGSAFNSKNTKYE